MELQRKYHPQFWVLVLESPGISRNDMIPLMVKASLLGATDFSAPEPAVYFIFHL